MKKGIIEIQYFTFRLTPFTDRSPNEYKEVSDTPSDTSCKIYIYDREEEIVRCVHN